MECQHLLYHCPCTTCNIYKILMSGCKEWGIQLHILYCHHWTWWYSCTQQKLGRTKTFYTLSWRFNHYKLSSVIKHVYICLSNTFYSVKSINSSKTDKMSLILLSADFVTYLFLEFDRFLIKFTVICGEAEGYVWQYWILAKPDTVLVHQM